MLYRIRVELGCWRHCRYYTIINYRSCRLGNKWPWGPFSSHECWPNAFSTCSSPLVVSHRYLYTIRSRAFRWFCALGLCNALRPVCHSGICRTASGLPCPCHVIFTWVETNSLDESLAVYLLSTVSYSSNTAYLAYIHNIWCQNLSSMSLWITWPGVYHHAFNALFARFDPCHPYSNPRRLTWQAPMTSSWCITTLG